MARLDNDKMLVDGNRIYFKIPLTLEWPDVEFTFLLHNNVWQFYSNVVYQISNYILTHWCTIKLLCGEIYKSFKVKIGIAGETREVIVAQSAKRLASQEGFEVDALIEDSEFESLKLSNKILYLFAEIRLEDEIQLEKKITGVSQFQVDFTELLLSGKNCDVVIKVSHVEFRCHRCILGARSVVFAAMLEHNMKEKISGLITIVDTDPDVFQQFLFYMYAGREDCLDWKNVTELFKLSDKYDVRDLRNLCIKYMKKNISVENFYDFFLLSQQHCISELSNILIEFFLKNAKYIVDDDKWLVFLSINPVECNPLIKALVAEIPDWRYGTKSRWYLVKP